jgi:hypothetical protein
MNTMKKSRRRFVLAGIALLATAAAVAAPRLEPPSKFVKQDRYNSAVARIAERMEDGRYKIELVEELYGTTPDGLVVVVDRGSEGFIEVGSTYVMSHTDKPRRRSHRWNVDPAGPRVLGIPAVGPAALENTEAMRTLVRAHPEDAPLTDAKRLAAVIQQLGSEDVLSRRFVLAELVLDSELRALVGDEELEVLKKTIQSGTLEPMAHEYMLRAAMPMLDSWGSDWLTPSCRKLAEENGTELDLASLIPSLLVVSFEMLAEAGDPADAELARKHVASNNPGVGKAAFRAMAILDRELATQTAPGFVEDETLHPDTRRFVAQFQAGRDLSRGP